MQTDKQYDGHWLRTAEAGFDAGWPEQLVYVYILYHCFYIIGD